ncbi:MAG TPA: hypothetical protein VMY05_08180 [Acidobacteriota bacterium]|nr:hypothetical protein [Acidobacteriota bacterium]
MNFRKAAVAALLGITILAMLSLYVPGCTDRLSGEKTPNQAPVVWFVNVPPEDSRTSTNPIINWVGQDIDGQVVMFRYVVFTEQEIIDTYYDGIPPVLPLDSASVQPFVDEALMKLEDIGCDTVYEETAGGIDTVIDCDTTEIWTYLEVDPQAGDPKTSNIIPMSAEVSDPVRVLIRQYIFVQAFDEQGLGSEIIFRAFDRNDNPPDTRIIGFLGGPFINAESSGGSVTGVHMRWQGSDIVDFPTDPPPFEFEWRLYGPYLSDTINDSTWEEIQLRFVRTVFVTRDARLFRYGENDTLVTCDTSWVPYLDTVIEVIECDSIPIDTITVSNVLGYIDTIYDVADPDFAADPLFDRVAAQSYDTTDRDEWISNLRDSVYDVFAAEPSDTTQEQYFIFWVRSRDDAKVPDMTPAFETFSVIDPHYERDIGILDVQFSFFINAGIRDSARAYWVRAIDGWENSAGTAGNSGAYDDATDYMIVNVAQGIGVSLRQMLAHKILILVNDNSYPGAMANPDFSDDIFTAIDAGVNVWMCGRAQFFGGEASGPNFEPMGGAPAGLALNILFYFGIEQFAYSGWEWHILGRPLPLPPVRIEDFVGALSLEKDIFPNLTVDTAQLHQRYLWKDHYPWNSDIAALPEVDWFIRTPGSLAMYLYKSKYGSKHFLNDPNFDFQGKPVAHRLNRGLFRTVYFMFTPYALADSSMQVTIDAVLDWLYERYATTPPAAPRYLDAGMPTTVQEVRQRYWERMERKALQDPKLAETFR